MAKNSRNPKPDQDSSWLSSLVQQVAADSAAIPSKAERVERRQAKKRRRQEQRGGQHKKQKKQQQQHGSEHESSALQKRSRQNLLRFSKYLQTYLADYEIHPKHKFVSTEKKGKAVSFKRWNSENLQPRKQDYGGLGLARPTLFIALNDPSFIPRLEQEFTEHIPGFFGKQRTKAMKKQLDGNMLWRRLAEKRIPKNMKDLTPDKKVEAMLDTI